MSSPRRRSPPPPPEPELAVGAGGQMYMRWPVEGEVAMPATLGECTELGWRYPEGKCRAWHCRYNLVLNTHRSGSTETITVGARGGKGKGSSLPSQRSERGKVNLADLERMADAAADRHNTLASTCVFDYAADGDLVPGRAEVQTDEDGRTDIEATAHMTLAQVGEVQGMTREAVRRIEVSALQRLRAAHARLAPDFVPAEAVTRRSVDPIVRRKRKIPADED